MIHDRETIRAAAALGDRLAAQAVARMREIERGLMFDEDLERRDRMKAELMEITSRKEAA